MNPCQKHLGGQIMSAPWTCVYFSRWGRSRRAGAWLPSRNTARSDTSRGTSVYTKHVHRYILHKQRLLVPKHRVHTKTTFKKKGRKVFEVLLEICTLANQIYARTLQRDLLCHGLSFLPNCWIPTCRPLNLEKNVFDPDRWANRGRGRNDFSERAVVIVWVSSWKTQRRDECSPLVASNPKSSWLKT